MPNSIRALCNQMGWPQTELGQKLGGLHYNTVKNWETGVNDPKASQIVDMADLFGCTVAQVMGLEWVAWCRAARCCGPLSITARRWRRRKLWS